MTQTASPNSTAVVDVGVILDLETWVGKLSNTCISMALSDFNIAPGNHNTTLVLHVRDSKKDVVGASEEALDLLKKVGVKAIIGPETTTQSEFVAHLGEKARVPILSFTATSPFLSTTRIPYFVRTAPDDSAQVQAIAAIVRAFEWRQVVPVYEDTYYGHGIVPFLTDALQQQGVQVPYRSVISASANSDQILKELYKLMTMQTRVFVVHMCFSGLGSRFFSRVNDAKMMGEGYVWITTNGITDFLDMMDPSLIHSMQGVLGVKSHVPPSRMVDSFTSRWKKEIRSEYPGLARAELGTIGLRAYDTLQALAKAIAKIQNAKGVSNMGGPELLQAISSTQFKGLSGEFRVKDGQLQSSKFEIINVVGKGGKRIGYWTVASGLTNKTGKNSTPLTTRREDLDPVLWPGKSNDAPRGWVIPTNNGRRLKIGVPTDSGFSDILDVKENSINGRKNVCSKAYPTGFVIDVFKAASGMLPYSIAYDFCRCKDGVPYDELVKEVYLQNYDAVVGDTTITFNRSEYVDFTTSFTEASVSMIVPIKGDKRKKPWIFLTPLSWKLWIASAAGFIFTGFVVWALEHRINDEFRGPPAQQMGVMLSFSFSHKEKLVSNLSRFVVTIWVFVVMILQSSYTASLASLLTVRQLHPTVQSMEDLIKNGDFVGYNNDSFVRGLLTKTLQFDESKLRAYLTPEEYHQALSKGSHNDGVAAIIDEIPYLKLVLGKYCGQYTMVGPTYKTDGFGFVFPRGSPLARDFSQAILKIREGKEMREIEGKWFPKGDQSECLKPSMSIESNSLSLDSFFVVFLITGAASALSLLISTIAFLHGNRHVLSNPSDPARSSVWHRTLDLLKHFDYRDLCYNNSKITQEPPMKELQLVADPTSNEASVSSVLHRYLQSPCGMSSNSSGGVGEEYGGTFSLEMETPDANSFTNDQHHVN
ncbi:hypothetical protein ACLOJK_030597 [Asimina triloba]